MLIVGFAQFIFSLSYYFGEYRKQSYAWFNSDIGGAYEAAIKSIKSRDVQRIYIDDRIYFAQNYFDFYQKKFGVNLQDKVSYFNSTYKDFKDFDKGSLVVIGSGYFKERVDKVGDFEKIEVIREPDGHESFYLFYRDI